MSIFFILLLILSLALNGVLVWYTIKLLNKLYFIQDNMEGLASLNNGFAEHLKELNEMEMYYGDETLKSLLKHSKFVVEQTEAYVEILSDLDVEEEEVEEEIEEG